MEVKVLYYDSERKFSYRFKRGLLVVKQRRMPFSYKKKRKSFVGLNDNLLVSNNAGYHSAQIESGK